MDKLKKIHSKDIIAIVVLIACFILISMGINHLVSGIAIMVITYYFARRADGEGNENISRKEIVIIDKQGRKLSKDEIEETNKKLKASGIIRT